MGNINRVEIDDFWADSTIVEAGDYVYTSYCMKNEGNQLKIK